MLFKTVLALGAVASSARAQRPSNTSICDYYTTALLTNNTAANQYTLLTLVVNTAVIGNYTKPNVGIAVPGILNPNGSYNGSSVNLVPYFNGAFASTNGGGSNGTSKNFLDGGGAAPLMKNMPANDMTSNQYFLLTHLYEFFGALLGCTQYGMSGFPAYAGDASMYNVHKFMVLSPNEMGYFITQVGLSAASFGVATADVTAVGKALAGLFDARCAPATTVIPAQGAQLQSICTDPTCPLAANSTCSAQPAIAQPAVANSTLAAGSTPGASGSMVGTATGTSAAAAAMTSGAAAPSTSKTSSAQGAASASLFGMLGAAALFAMA